MQKTKGTIKTHSNQPLWELGTLPLQDGQMPKQDLGNSLQTYWIEGRGEESISPFFFWGEARRQDGGERGGRSINTTENVP